MPRPTSIQIAVLEAVKQELTYLQTSNDIASPSHSTSIDYEMFANLPDEVEDDPRLDAVEKAVSELWIAVTKLSA